MENNILDFQNISSESAEDLNHHSLDISNISINVTGLSKIYKLYNAPIHRLKETLHPFRKKYHKVFYALKDINFQVKKGETFGIIGKNGSGKSTLLKIITGVLSPSSGNVSVNGRVSSLLELGAGFNPELNGIENIYFYGTINGFSKEQMDARLESILSFADIGEFVFQPVKSYSSGMYVRLAFAVAIQIDPEILIIDEALSVGDIFFQQKCARRMSDLKEKGVTIIFVSHDMGSVLNLCNQVVYLKNGAVVGVGESSKMIAEYYKEADVETNKESSEIVRELNEDIDFFSPKLIQKYQEKSVIKDVLENKFLKVLAINITDSKEDLNLNCRIGDTLTFRIIFLSKVELINLFSTFILRNRFDQIIFSGGTYTKKVTPLNCEIDKVYQFKMAVELSIEAGLYSLEIQIGQPLPNQLNRGLTLFSSPKVGPLTVEWDYENEIPPFYGTFGLNYDVS